MVSSWVTDTTDNKRQRDDGSTFGAPRSKRCKYGAALAGVYASTLTKLRTGARNFFQTDLALTGPSTSAVLTNGLERMDISEDAPNSSSAIMPTASSITSPTAVLGAPDDFCENCRRNRQMINLMNSKPPVMESCSFCDKKVCHVNTCASCNNGFCKNCSYQQYDDGVQETYVCTSCFQQ